MRIFDLSGLSSIQVDFRNGLNASGVGVAIALPIPEPLLALLLALALGATGWLRARPCARGEH